MKVSIARALLVAASLLSLARDARAQVPNSGVALDQFIPPPAGDALFAVPSPYIGGHLVLRADVVLESAVHPLAITANGVSVPIVALQSFLHAGVSLALWDRLLLSVSLPIAVRQSGESTTVEGFRLVAPQSAQLGDFRAGARVRIAGSDRDPFQLAVGVDLHFPTAPAESYAGENAVREAPQLLLGGRSKHLVWSATFGAMIRASTNASLLTFGGGIAFVFLRDHLQLGPEIYAATPIQDRSLQLTDSLSVPRGGAVNAETLLGLKARVVKGLYFGVAAGPGLTSAMGTPAFRAVGTIGWSPPPAAEEPDDSAAEACADKNAAPGSKPCR